MSLFRKKSIDKIVQDAEAGMTDGHSAGGLKKELGVRDLTFMGIAAVVGAGIFSTIGTAAYHGGPGISLLFVITAITCGFSALCYAEFASRVPIAGSAYTYAYVTFGELIAWIIGWALILEYAIGNIVVAISWSGYFVNLLEGFHIHLPGWLSTNYEQAEQGYTEALAHLRAGGTVETFSKLARIGYDAMTNAPMIGSWRVILNVPALIIVVLITALVYRGIKESKKSTNAMVIFKICIIDY
jgi:amino acid transporter